MITGVQSTESAPAQKSVSGSAPVRPDHGHRRSDQKDLTAGGRRHGGHPGDPGYEEPGTDSGPPQHEPNPLPHPPEPDAKPPPDEPGLVMARHLAGNDKSDEALGRLLDDLDGLNEPPPEDIEQRQNAQPVAPFLTSKTIDGPFHRAASAYQWGQSTLNSRDPLRPGAVYSERF